MKNAFIPQSDLIDHGNRFYGVALAEPTDRAVLPLGRIDGAKRLVCLHRYEPFWMDVKVIERQEEAVPETQFLFVELENGQFLMVVPLLDSPARASLQGGENGIDVVVESGDPASVFRNATVAYIAQGHDPYELLNEGAERVATFLGDLHLLRENKPTPQWLDSFGWCTWDAFYQEVSADKVREGLESFRKGGIAPRVLILDDGWQSVRDTASGGKRLASFAPNEKFSGDLSPTIQLAKDEFGVNYFFVWHAITGYWGGAEMPGYGVRSVQRRSSPGILHHRPTLDGWWGKSIGLIGPEHIHRFYNEYHRSLRKQGVDGVKVDVQAQLESVADGTGGRVELLHTFREALEGSVAVHFGGNLINCMSCSNDMLYSARASTVTRTSTDFWPNQPETHGKHIWVNAWVSAWFGHFIHPDWDMFQSGHPAGRFHAIGRVVSGGPVYVSDKPDAHDFDLLKRLVTPAGRILRGSQGVLARDSLLFDPHTDNGLLKVFSVNSSLSAMVGVFNCRPSGAETTGSVRPADVRHFHSGRFVAYRDSTGELRHLGPEDEWPVTLGELGAELFTIVRIVGHWAPIGCVDYFNAGGALEQEFDLHEALISEPGKFLAWCDQKPASVEINGKPVPFTFSGNRLEIDISEHSSALRVWWE